MSTNPTPAGDSEWESHIETDPEKRAAAAQRLRNWRPLLAARHSKSYLDEQIALIEEYANTRG